MDSLTLIKLGKFVSILLENIDADELGYTMVKSGVSQDELDDFLGKKPPWVYESPDNGKTVYRRRVGEDDREIVNDDLPMEGC
jgi:hypothetical protein